MPFPRILLAAVLWIGLARGQVFPNPGAACAKCHPRETSNYAASSMGRSIGLPSQAPAGKVTHAQSGTVITIDLGKGGEMRHRLSENGLTAKYPIAFEIGAGQVGHSYVARVGDSLLQSPASFYKRGGWDISPGFENTDLLDFNRVIGAACLTCHSNSAALSPVAIGCERCHGDTAAHQRNPSARNIVNPAKLPVRARDSVCEQCHLEGLARVMNPGKTLGDFHAGQELESTWTTYVEDVGSQVNAVSHVEQLALSRCASQSGGKLWCGTCHDPHGNPRASAQERHAQIRAICSSCHSALSKASHPATQAECESCHMPRRAPTDVAHAAITDHRLLKRAGASASNASAAARQIRAWREPAPELVQRNLGLAEIQASARPGWASLGPAGAALLASAGPLAQQNDAVVLAAAGSAHLAEGRVAEALQLLLRAAQLEPGSAQYAMYAGIALRQSGEMEAAARELNRSIDLDPSLEQAYLELSALFGRQHRTRESAATLDRYLKWNPQSILVRLAREALP